jgi:hypothetical protein
MISCRLLGVAGGERFHEIAVLGRASVPHQWGGHAALRDT